MSMFWKVKPVPKEDEANMRAELVTVSELTRIFGNAPKPQPRPKPQQPLALVWLAPGSGLACPGLACPGLRAPGSGLACPGLRSSRLPRAPVWLAPGSGLACLRLWSGGLWSGGLPWPRAAPAVQSGVVPEKQRTVEIGPNP